MFPPAADLLSPQFQTIDNYLVKKVSKIGLFGKLFKKKDNPVSPDPVVSAPSKPVISTKTDNFKVAGISSYMDNLMELAYEMMITKRRRSRSLTILCMTKRFFNMIFSFKS